MSSIPNIRGPSSTVTSHSAGPSSPTANPASAKTNSIAQSALATLNHRPKSPSCCSRFWTLLKCITFPLSWLIEKIVNAVQASIQGCKKSDETNDNYVDPTGSATGGSLSSTESVLAVDILDSPVDNGAKVAKFCAQGNIVANRFADLEKLANDATNGIDALYGGKPEAPVPQPTLAQFFDMLRTVNAQATQLKHARADRASCLQKYQAGLAAFKMDELPDDQRNGLKENEARVLSKLKEDEALAKKFDDVAVRWATFLKDNKDEILRRFQTYQQAQPGKIEALIKASANVGAKASPAPTAVPQAAPTGALMSPQGTLLAAALKQPVEDPKKKALELYSTYMNVFNLMKNLDWVQSTDPAHVELQKKRSALSDAIGLYNPSVSCWRNSTLQAMRGVPEINNRIKNMAVVPRLPAESVEQFQERQATMKPLAPKRAQETNVEFAARLKGFEDRYPVMRSDAVEKMLHEAKLAAGLPSTEPRKAETADEFQARLKANNLTDFVTNWKKQGEREDRIPGRLLGVENAYKKGNHVVNDALALIPAETDQEFAARQAKYNADLHRRMESDDEVALKQQVLDALKAVWNAWENDESALNTALEQLQDAIFNGVYSEFNELSRNQQLDSGDLFAVFMNVLGFSFDLKEINECTRLGISKNKVVPAHTLVLPLIDDAAQIGSLNELIQVYAFPKEADPAKGAWRVNVAGASVNITDFSSSVRISSDPPPVMAIKLGRRYTGDQQGDIDKITAIPNWDPINKLVANNLGRQPSSARQAAAVRAYAQALAGDDNMDREITVEPTVILTPLFEDTIVAKCGGEIKYRVKGFTTQGGGAHGGHWVGYRVDDSGQWRYYSDMTVEPRTQAQIKQQIKKASVLTLERIP